MRTIKKVLVIVFVFLLVCIELQSQIVFTNPNLENFNVDYGVRSIVKDHDGFIWIGTDNSLTRFDGYKALQFVHSPEDSTTVSSKSISCILPDKKGNLWIATMGGGLNLYIKETNSFKRFYYNAKNKRSLSHNWVNKIFVDSKQRLWVCTQNGLNQYNYKTQTFTRHIFNFVKIEKPTSLTKSSLLDIAEDRNGNLWLTTSDGLHKFNPTNNKHSEFDKNYFNVKSEFSNICIDENNIIWLSSHRGPLLKIIAENFKDTVILKAKTFYMNKNLENSLPDHRISKIIRAKNDHLWIATENGLSYFDIVNEVFRNFYHDPNDEKSLSSNAITELYLDNQNILWVGTLNNGIVLYDPNNNRFVDEFPFINKSTLPAKKFIKSIYKDKSKKYWIGTDFGLLEFSQSKQILNQYTYNPANPKTIGRGGVTGFAIDINGRYWVSTWGGGLALFDPIRKQFSRIPFHPDSAFSSNYIGDFDIRTMKKDLTNNLWLGSAKGFLDEFNPRTYKFTHHFIYDKDSLRGVSIKDIAVDQENNVWATTTPQGRLIKYNRNSGNIEHYSDRQFENSGFGTIEAISLYVDNNNTVWVGSNHGVYKYNKKEDRFYNFSVQNKLPEGSVRYITGDNFHSLWLSSGSQLIEYNLKTKIIRFFNQKDGLFPMANYGFLTSENELLLGGKNGINAFNPHKLAINKDAPPIVLSELRINDQLQTLKTLNTPLKNEINQTQKLVLDYDQSTFSISFSALNYSQTNKNQYAFMLEGLDNDWSYVGNRRTAFYTNLRPGKYVFKVKGSNNDGVWNPVSKSIIIVVNPPWYNSPLAYVVYFIIITLLIYVIIHYTNERQKLKHSIELQKLNFENRHAIDLKEKEINDSKLHFFSNISHEIRTPLTLILSPLYDVIQNEKLSSVAKKSLTISHLNAKRLHKLVNQLLDLSKVESGFMRLEVSEANIAESISTIVESLSPKAKKKDVQLNLSMNHHDILGYYDLDKLEKILTNIVDNAIKHAPEKSKVKINVNFAIQNKEANINQLIANSVKIQVTDNGKGISQEIINKIFEKFYQAKGEQGAGIGLFLAKSLTEIHGGVISVVSKPYIETIFEITLPLSKSAFAKEAIIDNHLYEEPIVFDEIKLEQESDIEQNNYEKGKPIVLIVEDEVDLRNYIKSIFTQFQVITATNGIEGFNLACEHIPDIIICDVMMPEMDGFELTKAIKTNESTSHIPVILLTAKNTNEDQLKGLQLGAIDYIAKPFNSNSLLLKVNNQIKNRREFGKQFIGNPDINVQKLKFNSTDQKFINKLNDILEANYTDPDFDFSQICSQIGLSRAQLYRKVTSITGKTVNEYIRIYRLKKAAQMLIDEGLNVSEIMYNVGFKNSSYFAKCFKDFFGVLPSEYLKEKK